MGKSNWRMSFLGIVCLGLVYIASPVNAAGTFPTVNVIGPIDALTELNNDVVALPDSAFRNVNNREALLNKIDAVINQIESGAYNGAVNKLESDIKDKVRKWINNSDQNELMEDIEAAIVAVNNASETTVPTLYGKVAGADAGNNSWIWEGVPYAKPPIGALRWKAPQDPDPWRGVRQSTIKFNPAVQPNMAPLWYPLTTTPIGSEDCLFLNIFAPKNAAKDLPVFVWIHGGANVFGQASIYNASLLASRANMVVVVIQYRLGPFGWLYFPALNPNGTAEDKSGNYGTLDTIKAVQWVKDNIRSFGGNPENITVGGQSAGGFNTLNLLTSPLSQGLFQRALVMSAGGADVPASTNLAYKITNKLLGLPDSTTPPPGMSDAEIAAYLKSKSAYEIEQALMVNGSIPLGTISPYIDGTVITDTFANNIQAGNYSQIPIVLGNTGFETKPFEPLLAPLIGAPWQKVFSFLFAPSQATFNSIFSVIYPSTLYELCGYYGALDWKAVMVDQLATSIKNYQNDVYAYHFMWGGVSDPGDGSDIPKDRAFLYGAGHATDIPFFFGWDIDVYNIGLFNPSNYGGRVALQQAMMSYLANFAASGNPNGSGLTIWQPWSNVSGDPKYISFDATPTDINTSMMTDSYTRQDVLDAVDGLPNPAYQKSIIKVFFFF